MTAILWPVVVLVLGILTLLAVYELVGRHFNERREERVSLTQRAQVDAEMRRVMDALQELRDSVARVEMAAGLK